MEHGEKSDRTQVKRRGGDKVKIRAKTVKLGISGKFSPIYGNITFSLENKRRKRVDA
jgi:hypothetical protein